MYGIVVRGIRDSIADILEILGASAIVYGIIGDAALRFIGYK
jgi:hypothetical protein